MRRLRPDLTDAELAARYSQPHNPDTWPGHHDRMVMTAALAVCMWPGGALADLSAGTGRITELVCQQVTVPRRYLGDLAPGWEYEGPIEDTIWQIPTAGLFILSETIEHLADPPAVLTAIRVKARRLVLSTPLDEPAPNPEHVWAWTRPEMEATLLAAGWNPTMYVELVTHGFPFQLWGCS